MKRNTKIAVAIITVVGIASGTAAIARGNMGEKMVSHISERLELNEAQTTALTTLQTELKETRELVRGNSGDNRQTIMNLVTAESFDQGAALEMITARTTAMQTQAPELVAAAAGFLDGLDAAQKEELTEMMQRFGKRGKHRHGDNN